MVCRADTWDHGFHTRVLWRYPNGRRQRRSITKAPEVRHNLMLETWKEYRRCDAEKIKTKIADDETSQLESCHTKEDPIHGLCTHLWSSALTHQIETVAVLWSAIWIHFLMSRSSLPVDNFCKGVSGSCPTSKHRLQCEQKHRTQVFSVLICFIYVLIYLFCWRKGNRALIFILEYMVCPAVNAVERKLKVN